MYDAETGAFVTRDPVTGGPGEPARRVAYAYAFNGPGRFVDLDGLSPLDFVKKVVENQTTVYRAARDVAAALAAYQTRAAQRTIDDPFANPLAKDLARVSKLLTSRVDCADDIDSAVFFFFTRGRGRGATAPGGQLIFRPNTNHIFRDAPGHLAKDTAANRKLLMDAVHPNNLVRKGGPGGSISQYRKTLPDGRQVWVDVRNGREITNGGVNAAPR